MHDIIYRRDTCRGCEGHDLDLVFSLKPTPIGDAYVTSEKIDVIQPSYPIDLYMCKSCGLAQLIDVIDPDILYGEYIYVTASSTDLSAHRLTRFCSFKRGITVEKTRRTQFPIYVTINLIFMRSIRFFRR